MASVCKINDKWRALVRRKGHKPTSKSFATKAQAEAWARKIEAAIDSGKMQPVESTETVAQIIHRYREMREISHPIGDTANEHYTLKALEADLGELVAAKITTDDLIGWAHHRKQTGSGPYTINMALSKLGTVLKYAGSETLPDIIGKARPRLAYLRLIGGGGKRERRPTLDELERIIAWLRENRGNAYADAVEFAVATAMRRGEITRVIWSDIDEVKRLICIRDRKDPRNKAGNDQWIPLLGEAWDIAQRQPKTDERIFPIHEQTLSKYFRNACVDLGINDLHFHDLRHEGTSRLFEEGYAIQQVALVTGHKSWNHLRRYAQLKPEDLHRKK